MKGDSHINRDSHSLHLDWHLSTWTVDEALKNRTKHERQTLSMWLSQTLRERNSFRPYFSNETGITFHSYSITLIHSKLDFCTIWLANQIKMTKKKKITLQKNKPKAIFQAWNGKNYLYLKGITFSWQLGSRGHYPCSLFHLTWLTTLKSSSTISSSHSYYISCGYLLNQHLIWVLKCQIFLGKWSFEKLQPPT